MFASREDLDVALKEVDGSEMRNMRGTCTLRVDPADGGGGGGGGGGRDRERDRSPPRRSRCALSSLHVLARLFARASARGVAGG